MRVMCIYYYCVVYVVCVSPRERKKRSSVRLLYENAYMKMCCRFSGYTCYAAWARRSLSFSQKCLLLLKLGVREISIFAFNSIHFDNNFDYFTLFSFCFTFFFAQWASKIRKSKVRNKNSTIFPSLCSFPGYQIFFYKPGARFISRILSGFSR